MRKLADVGIAVIGLGYVGLPLASAFGARFRTVGFDLRRERVAELAQGRDATLEVTPAELAAATRLRVTDDAAEIAGSDVYILTVPTPVDDARRPDFSPLLAASRTVGGAMRKGAVVVFESTVYPGATEEICVPALEAASGLTFNRDFQVGYSPERVNPGDPKRRLRDIRKVVAGSTPETTDFLAELYGAVVSAGTHKVSSIKVGEAAKVIENTQRDLNIALVNELALICHRVGVDTEEVLQAAGTKWNFLPFRPGLVGGHCIGVDPYYLTHKAQQLGYHPEVILAGRRINDGMGRFVATEAVRLMACNGATIRGSQVLVLGLAFKENCPDIRNTRVIDLVRELQMHGAEVHVWDPLASAADARREYGLELSDPSAVRGIEAVVAAVAHREFVNLDMTELARHRARERIPFLDVKCAFSRDALGRAGFDVWRL